MYTYSETCIYNFDVFMYQLKINLKNKKVKCKNV